MPNVDRVSNARANYATGAVQSAPVGTTLPTSASAQPAQAFINWGFVSDSGISKTVTRSTETKKDMNGNTVLVVTKEHSCVFKFKPLEISAEAMKVTYGDSNVTVDGNGDITGYSVKSDELTPRSYIFDLILSGGKLMRVVVPKGQIKSTGAESLKLTEMLNSELEIEALEDTNGVKAYVYYANPTSTGCSLLNYSIRALGIDFAGDINEQAGTISVTVPNGVALTALVATFANSNGASVKINDTAQVSGTTSNNFTSPKTYSVTAADGAHSKNYTVTVTAAEG